MGTKSAKEALRKKKSAFCSLATSSIKRSSGLVLRRILVACFICTLGFIGISLRFAIFDTARAQALGVVGEWKFDEGVGTTTADSSGFGNTGILVNGPTWTTGKLGNALQFDGVNDYVDAGNSASLNPANAITIAAWVKPSAIAVSQFIVAKDNLPVPGLLQYFLRVQGVGRVRFAVRTNTEGYLTTGALLSANTWYHVVGVYDGTDMRIYVNGASAVAPLSKTGTMTNNGVNVRMGGAQNGTLPFKGVLDEVRIYDRALNASEVLALYQGGSLPPADTVPPTVSITSPTPAQVVSGNVPITANASDNVGVVGVQFKLDGANLAAEDTAAPYAVSWDTLTATNGSHTLTAVARDAAGNTATSPAVMLTVDNSPPTVPGNLSATAVSFSRIDLSWNPASDNVAVAGYRIFRDNLQIATSASPAYSDTGLSPATTYAYTVSAFDAAGNSSAQSSPVSATTLPPVDTAPPSVSITSLTQAQIVTGNVTITANASDDVGVVGVQFMVDGANWRAEDTTAPYSIAWDTTQSSDGAHSLTAVARDAAGNTATSPAVTVTVDNSPPTVPGNLSATAVSFSRIDLSWNPASDNVAVAGYRIFRDNLQIATSAFPAYSDTGLLASTTYTYAVSAYDTAGNHSAQSAPTTATTLPSSGLLGEYHFEEGAGTTTADSSGFGNTGILVNGPTWTTGKLGNALQFDGVNDYVDAGNSASLNPANAITIAAWVKPSTTAVSQFIVAKDNLPVPGLLQYYLRVQGTGIRFAVRTNTEGYLTTGALLSANNWYHVVGVYDGADMRIYVNGASAVAPLSKTGTMTNNGVNVRIGVKQYGALPFKGVLDEVRIYGRALSATEVLGLYNAKTDTTPPTASITSPTDNSSVSGTIAVGVSADDDVAVDHVELYVDGFLFGKDASIPYELILSTARLAAGSHRVVARAVDTSNNEADSQAITLLVDNHASATMHDIVFILTDDQRFDTMQYMPLTSALLKDASVRFDVSIDAEPVCCPTRASILSGLYSHNHGVLENQPPQGGAQVFDDSSTIATWLKQAGYRTGLFGKYLNGYQDMLPHFVPPGWDDWHGSISATTLDYNYWLFENGIANYYGYQPRDYGTDVLAARTIRFIETTPPGQPLFIYFAPHNYIPGPGDVGTFAWFPPWRPPSFDETDVSDKPYWVRQLPPLTAAQIADGDAFHQMQLEVLQSIDRAVAGIVDALQRTGRFDNAAIIYTSDNGLTWGEHRWPGNKWCVYEECIRVPLWVRVPGVPGRSDGRLIVNVDFGPTFAEWAGVVPPTKVDGYSIATLLNDVSAPWPNERLVEYLGVSGGNGVAEKRFRAIRTSQYVYAEYDNGDREFYDLIADPFQLTNAINDPAYASVINTLKNVLAVQKNL